MSEAKIVEINVKNKYCELKSALEDQLEKQEEGDQVEEIGELKQALTELHALNEYL